MYTLFSHQAGMNLLATGHMLADVVAIMGKFFPRPHFISFSCPGCFRVSRTRFW